MLKIVKILRNGKHHPDALEKMLLPGRHTGKSVGNMILKSGNEQLDAYWHRGSPDLPVILFSHGNGEHLTSVRHFLKEFFDRQYSIFAYDYSGYGGSTGKASEKQLYSDAESAYLFLTEQKQIPASRIIVFGYSIGSVPGCYLAEKSPVKRLVLAAPLASALQVFLPFSLPLDIFPNVKRLRDKMIDLLIFHGKCDSIIPCRNSLKIYNAAKGKKKIILDADADHNDLIFRLENRFWNELASMAEDTATDTE